MEKTRRTVQQPPESPTSTGSADKKIRPQVPFDLYAFPFENVVFEGGSGNLLAFVGAVRVSFFYRAMDYSAKRGLAIACRLSVRLSVTLVDQDHRG